ncbi:exported protein of unknown function [Beijerinckiaceae bacterium RH AL1]|jgi:hypothetical protein|nr:exported protein of unknown function [Beijerinckiaceae bacterium RH CH11]VVB48437.1 exported protein of unknown function [Beijerinckiaceae bacterium RH AL8]VVC56352.1 exported protein of unknown function [Beijerinckiaceae bacterium RH AL1]
MAFKHALIAVSLLALAPATAMAQGTVRGAEEGAAAGDRAAGPVGGVVGGAVGAATGTVGGVAGVRDRDHGCSSKTVTHEDAAGSDTVKRTNCD